MSKVISIEPNTMAVFHSTDGHPGFGVHLCNEGTLLATVHKTMFWRDVEIGEETRNVHAALLKEGKMDFEDGWLVLTRGMAATVEFLVRKIDDIKADNIYADNQRYEEHKRREAAELKYEALRSALVAALGEHGPEIAAKAAA